jgi:uncharacterized membrane protein YidH (DUF202 family)
LEDAQEIQRLVVAYAKQETVDPLKSLGRYLGLGLAGSFLVFLGALFTSLGVLRVLQTETDDRFSGGSFASLMPYVIAFAVLLLIMATILLLFNRARKRVQS